MNFLGIGPFELLLVLIIATIVLGPERMAQAGRTLGRLYAQYRLRWQKDVDEMTRELRRELAMLQQEVEEIRQTAESEIKTAQATIESVVDTQVIQDTAVKDSDTTQSGVASVTDSTEGAEQAVQIKRPASTQAEADEVET
jgi:Sec-independent protein translocase protein TatA